MKWDWLGGCSHLRFSSGLSRARCPVVLASGESEHERMLMSPKYECLYLNIDYIDFKPGTYQGVQILTIEGRVLDTLRSRDYKLDLSEARRAALLLARMVSLTPKTEAFEAQLKASPADRISLSPPRPVARRSGLDHPDR